MTASDPSQTLTLEPTADLGVTPSSGRLVLIHPPGLRFEGSDDAGALTLGRDPIVLGRRPSPEAGDAGRLAHGTVSREHLKLAWDGRSRAHIATDLDSHNGTWVDGQKVGAQASVALADGAVVRIGGVVLVYEAAHIVDTTSDFVARLIPGRSRAIQQLRRQIATAGPDPSPALILGETGVGKEYVARALHELSGRRGPLVSINVSELAPQLVESQLFGHMKGAFTGADRAHDGLFRAADGGTLFLDEVGELPIDLQPKLLRVLQESEVRPVGGTRPTKIDVRVIAATNRDLAGDIERGTFRRDLYARLALWELTIPSLADRRPDLLLWVDLLHRRWCDERQRPHLPLTFEADALELVLMQRWPDNLRGLDRFVHRLATRDGDGPVTLAQLATLGLAATAQSPLVEEPSAMKRPAPASREELIAVVAECGGNMQAVARHYGRDRRQVYRWLDAFQIPRGSRD